MSQYFGKSTNSFDCTNDPAPAGADERSEILAWLSPLDPRIRHQDLRAERVEGVGDWLLQTGEFQSWYSGTHRDESVNTILFCHGDPGVGKTYISSLVIDTLCEQARRWGAAVSCFYVDFAARGEQSPANILGSLLKQLVRGFDEVPEEVVHAFRDPEIGAGDQAPQLADIVKLFQTITASQRTIICIDALDECSLGDRLKLLSSLSDILRGSSRTRLFLTGKPHIRSEIEEQLGGAVVVVSITTSKDDVIRYLCARLDEDPAPDAMNSILKADIVRRISGTLSTIFLMASLNIDGILRETTIFRRRRRLSAMTDDLTLGDTYRVSLERIRAQDRARSRFGIAVLMWVCHSERPLHMDELCHALAVEVGDTDTELESGNVPSRGTLLGCCQGLVIVDREFSTARLIHSTLQEYLYAHSEYFASSHSTIAETCLTYLNSQQVKDLSANPSPDLRDKPFLSYASRYWGTHAKMELSENAKSLALQLLNQYDGHVSARLLLQQVWSSDCVEPDSSSVFTGLHCACLFGITEVVDILVGMKGRGINQRDWVGVTPLIWAAMYGHQDVVKLLLGQGDIDPTIPDRGFGQTALSWAKGNGHERVVDLLLGWEDVGPSMRDGQDGQGEVQHPHADFLFQKGIRSPCSQSNSKRSTRVNNEPLDSSPAPALMDDVDAYAEPGADVVPRHRLSAPRHWVSAPRHWVSAARRRVSVVRLRVSSPKHRGSRFEPVTSSRQQGMYGETEIMHRRTLAGIENALGRDHPDTSRSSNVLGLMLYNQGKYEEVEIMHRRTLADREKVLGIDHADTLQCVNNLGETLYCQKKYGEAEIMYRRVLAGREKALGREHPDTLRSFNALGLALHNQGKYLEAEIVYRHALAGSSKALGIDHADTLRSLNNLGETLYCRKTYGESEILHRRALADREKALGREHRDTLLSVSGLGAALNQQGEHDVAEIMHQRALAGGERALGENHLDTLQSVRDLGVALCRQEKCDEAEVVHRGAFTRGGKTLGLDHQDSLRSASDLGAVLRGRGEGSEVYRRAAGGGGSALRPYRPDILLSVVRLAVKLLSERRYEEAEIMYRHALRAMENALGPDHPDTLDSADMLGETLLDLERYDEAEAMCRRALAGREKTLGAYHAATLISADNLGWTLYHQRKYEEAEVMFQSTQAGRKKVLGLSHPDTLLSVLRLGVTLLGRKKYEEAEIVYRHALPAMENTLGPDNPVVLDSMNTLGETLLDLKKYSEAEVVCRRALVGREKTLGPDHRDTLLSVNNLGLALRNQDKHREAEINYRRAVVGAERTLGLDHRDTLTCLYNLAGVLHKQRMYHEAEMMHRRALEGRVKVLGLGHRYTLRSLTKLGAVLYEERKYDEAEIMYRRAVMEAEKALGPCHPATLKVFSHLSMFLYTRATGALDEAL